MLILKTKNYDEKFKENRVSVLGTAVIHKGESFFVQANKIQYLNNVCTELGVKYA